MRDLDIDPVTQAVVQRRLLHEGLTFVTKTLPRFSKYVLQCIEKGSIIDPRTVGLTHFSLKRGAPSFMQGYLLDAMAGSASALSTIRQLCDYYYKTAFDFSEADLKIAEDNYVKTDEGVGVNIDRLYADKCRKTLETMFPGLTHLHFHDVLSNRRPRFGPGSVIGNPTSLRFEEWKLIPSTVRNIPQSLRSASGYFKPYPSAKTKIAFNPAIDERLCEIVFVPKDSRGPRVISKENANYIRPQMSFNDFFSVFRKAL
jgi:hypothetical protein